MNAERTTQQIPCWQSVSPVVTFGSASLWKLPLRTLDLPRILAAG